MRIFISSLLMAACSAHAAEVQLQARDINRDGAVDAYYDPNQNLSFAADANLAGTLGDSDNPGTPGTFMRPSAEVWAESLNLYGITGWRLPRMLTFEASINPDDGTITQWDPTSSEIGNLPTLAPFVNRLGPYWSETYVPACMCWNEGFNTYISPGSSRPHGFTKEGSLLMYVWAVHDGDVGELQPTPIPEPSTYLLLAGGLAALALRGRRTTAP